MTFKECKQLIKSDLSRIAPPTYKNFIKNVIFHYSFMVTFWYRICVFFYSKSNFIYLSIYLSIYRHVVYKTGIQLPICTQVGSGLLFFHFSCIVINGDSIIGNNCTILQGVTIGSIRGEGSPKIGNNVIISAGAKIIGDITIGNNVMIGAGAVVIKDIPDNAVVVGNPGRIASFEGEKHVKLYVQSYKM